MIPYLTNRLNKKLLGVCLLILFGFSATPVCHATINKSSASVLVSTTDQNNWYDSSDSATHAYLVCDAVYSVYDTTHKKNEYIYPFPTDLSYMPCDRDNIHDDYYSADTDDETNTYPSSENFTIKASASASSGSMAATRIEWIATVTDMPDAADWTSADVESQTCSGTGTCTVCVQGGTCSHPVIPKADLGVYPDTGAQRKLFFRAVFTDSSGNTVVMGQDDTLDKFYRFVICGPACPVHTCDMHAPSVNPASVTPPASPCKGLNDTDGYYKVNWSYADLPLTAVQTYYKVTLRDAATGTVLHTYESSSAATSYKIPTSWITYSKNYDWQVEVRFSGEGCSWDVTSPWSSGGTSISVPAHYPVPSFTVKNPTAANCLAGSCLTGENLTFNGSASTTYSGGTPTYSWVVDGVAKSGASFSQSFTTKPHTAKLTVKDGGGRSCSLTKSFNLTDPVPTCTGTPTASIGGVFSPGDLCAGLNDTDSYYALTWNISNLPSGTSQIHYKVSVRDKATGTVQTDDEDSSSTIFQVPSAWLSYNKSYDWMVQVTIAGGGCTYTASSPWSSGSNNIVVPVQYPIPAMTVKNPSSADCLTDSACHLGESITFNGSGSSIFSGTPTYAWNLDGSAKSGASFSQSFVTKPHAASLTVTDGLGRSCSIARNVNLGDAICASGLKLDNVKWTRSNFCSSYLDYTLHWASTMLPAGAKQTKYKITVRDKNDTLDTHTRTVNDSVGWFEIPSSWIDYNTTYEWQVTATYVSADGLCTWNLTLPFASSPNFSTGHCYPTPSFSVKNAAGGDCIAGGCNLLDDVTFDASSSVTCAGSPTYDWVLDGVGYSGVSFTKKFISNGHTFSLKVTDGDNYACTSDSIDLDLNRTHAQWNEVAPVSD